MFVANPDLAKRGPQTSKGSDQKYHSSDPNGMDVVTIQPTRPSLDEDAQHTEQGGGWLWD